MCEKLDFETADDSLKIRRLKDAIISLANGEYLKKQISTKEELYAVNWDHLKVVARASLLDNIVENTTGLGMYHTRMLRILRKKGFTSETDLKVNSLLPARDCRAVINQLSAHCFLQRLSIPISGTSQSMTVYQADERRIRQYFRKRIAQSIINVLARHGKLGKMSGLTREFNVLHFY